MCFDYSCFRGYRGGEPVYQPVLLTMQKGGEFTVQFRYHEAEANIVVMEKEKNPET